jgi:Mor family transcriptional regulator
MEKIERFMDVKIPFFKKEHKQQAASIMSQLDKSPAFQALLNTEISLSEFHDLVHAAITKKIANSSSQ